MKKTILQIIIYSLVVLCLAYSVSALTCDLLMWQAGRNPLRAEQILRMAAKANPFNAEPRFRLGKVLHSQGLKTGSMDKFSEAQNCFLSAKSKRSVFLENDLMLLDIHQLLGASPLQIFREIKELNLFYPNNLIVQKLLTSQGVPLWNHLEKSDRVFLANEIHNLLLNWHRINSHILEYFLGLTKDIELIEKCIPKKISFLNRFISILPLYGIRFDFVKIFKLIENIEKIDNPENYYFKIEKNKKYLRDIENKWKEKFGKAESLISENNFIGYFKSGKEITNGNMWANGTIYGVVSLKTDTKNLFIKAKSSVANHVPSYMTVRINENILGGTYVDCTEYKEFVFPIISNSFGSESIISITFENDYYDKTKNQDRNLFVNSIRVE